MAKEVCDQPYLAIAALVAGVIDSFHCSFITVLLLMLTYHNNNILGTSVLLHTCCFVYVCVYIYICPITGKKLSISLALIIWYTVENFHIYCTCWPKSQRKYPSWASVFVGGIITHPGNHLLRKLSAWKWHQFTKTRPTHLLQSFLPKAVALLIQPAKNIKILGFLTM